MRRMWLFGVAVASLVCMCICAGALPSSASPSSRPATGSLTGATSLTSDAGSGTSCAVVSGGGVDCWGYGAGGQLGNGANSNSDVPVSTGITGAKTVVEDYEGGSFCALLTTDSIDCWGVDGNGDLGNGGTTNSDVPVAVENINTATSVVGGIDGFCALLSTHTIDCWGYGGSGQLGNGAFNSSDVPVAVENISNASKVVGGLFFFCSLLSTGHVDCWGANSDGELGNGTTTASDAPVPVKKITTAVSVTSGTESLTNCALLASGAVDCWGYNAYGELGDGTVTNSDVPVAATGIKTATSLAEDISTEGDGFGYCALLKSEHIECWGYNSNGELGNKKTTESNVPVAVKKIKTAVSIVGGDEGYCAVLKNESLDCWGRGDYGQLGNGNGTSSDVPVAVATITTGSKVESGYLEYCSLLKTTGGVDCWGYGGSYQLGDGSTSDANTPVAVQSVS
jgi:alpha-tubulin suppressor-like RCC1 family protein